MCGIAGYIGTSRRDERTILRTLELMTPRGPDHRAHVHFTVPDGGLDLLHSRLAVIDLDARAAQPMTRGLLTVVYNGEIYNYRELRRELKGRGADFTTDSDTEVLLHAYAAWGAECFEKFEGMWALALYDAREHSLLLARDRFGEKPLYWLRLPDGLCFGSEAKYVFALAGAKPSVNRRHLARYLVNGYKALGKTDEKFFVGLHALEPGTVARVNGSYGLNATHHWRPLVGRPHEMSFENAVEAVRQRLIESVRLRLRADVPVAFCLSGGVDSGALASIAVKALGQRVSTFSIVDRDERYDESANIRRTVEDLGCENVVIETPRTGALERLERLIEYRWAPVLTLSYYAHSLLSEEISRRGYKVAISGTGADELFTGYYDHFNLHLYEMRNSAAWPALRADWERHVRPHVRNPHLQRHDLYFENPSFRGHVYLNDDRFRALLRTDFAEEFTERRYCDSLLRNRMLNELLHEVVPAILEEDDANSMRVSIENRSPYLDSRLCELAFAIPPEHLIRDGRAKHVLRAALAGILDDAVRLDRRKVGFNVAFRSVVDTRDPATRERLLADGPVFELVDRARLLEVLDMDPLPNSFSKFLFSFVNARLFLDRFG
ncbi:MAG: asparagine synthase (glutamine-hydrolyzing) [Phycisphaerae bacterium]|jgi:asparagine synthase (glutamine-hydrolysing)